jgi:hypothetical protein
MCDYFEKKEEKMNIEFQGKTYERTDRLLGFTELMINAGNDSCPQESIAGFMKHFNLENMALFHPQKIIKLTPEMADWLATDSDLHIPWLVEKGYLRECVEEETYKVGQYFKSSHDNHLCVIVEAQGQYYTHGLFDITSNTFYGGGKSLQGVLNHIKMCSSSFTPIPPPKITEQPETTIFNETAEPTERRPEKCVHNSGNCPNTLMSASGCGLIKTARDCRHYSEE